MMLRSKHVYMDQAGDAGAAAGAAGAAGGAQGGTGSAQGAAGGQPGGEGTLLSAAAQAAAGGAQQGAQGGAGGQGQQGQGGDPLATIPAKLHVKGADGKLDPVATAAKVAEAYKQLETRMGAGEAPPEKPEGYKHEGVIAEIKKAGGKEFSLPPEFVGEFNKFAHDAKLSQAQYDKALTGMLAMTQDMVDQGFQQAMANGKAELSKVWGNDAADPKSERMQNAVRAFNRFVPANLRNAETMDAIGNHPVVMQVLEAVGRELKSDRAPNDQGGMVGGVNRLDQIYADQAYWNAKDPRHPALVSEAQQLFQKGHKPTAMKNRGQGSVTL